MRMQFDGSNEPFEANFKWSLCLQKGVCIQHADTVGAHLAVADPLRSLQAASQVNGSL